MLWLVDEHTSMHSTSLPMPAEAWHAQINHVSTHLLPPSNVVMVASSSLVAAVYLSWCTYGCATQCKAPEYTTFKCTWQTQTGTHGVPESIYRQFNTKLWLNESGAHVHVHEIRRIMFSTIPHVSVGTEHVPYVQFETPCSCAHACGAIVVWSESCPAHLLPTHNYLL